MGGPLEQAAVVEAKRQVENARWSYDQSRARLDEFLAAAREQQAYERMLSIVRSAGVSLLVIGQGAYVLDRDAARARKTFAELADWMPFIDGIRAGVSAGARPALSLHLVLEPLVCLLLADDRRSLERLAALEVEPTFLAPAKEPKAVRPLCQFLLDLLRLVGDQTPIDAGDLTPLAAGDVFAGYEKLVKPIAEKDSSAFESVRAGLEAAYPARQKLRDTTLNWYGAGKLSQTATFDALGTALCRLAVRRGLHVDIDTPLYPRVFIESMPQPANR